MMDEQDQVRLWLMCKTEKELLVEVVCALQLLLGSSRLAATYAREAGPRDSAGNLRMP